MLYLPLLVTHSVIRWLVLIIGVMAAYKALAGWLGQHTWSQPDSRLGLILLVVIDIQLLVGLMLYIFFSPLTAVAFQDVGAAMKNAVLRFFLVEHMPVMVIAIALIHVGYALSKRAVTATSKHKRAAIFYTIAMVMILISIPWPFLPYGRPLNPFHLLMGG